MFKKILLIFLTLTLISSYIIIIADKVSSSFGAKQVTFKQSAYYAVNIDSFNVKEGKPYGGIAPYNNSFIYSNYRGKLYYFYNDLFYKVDGPLIDVNFDEWLEWRKEETVLLKDFTVKDIFISKFEKNKIFASAIYYNKDEKCFNLSVFENLIKFTNKNNISVGEWKRVYETIPCLKLIYARHSPTDPGAAFNITSAGGRIIETDKDHILLSVGDFANDGQYNKDYTQDKKAHYGKTILINKKSYQSKIFTMGHRNPQGLTLTINNKIYLTEHGPMGGDEINLLKGGGSNYGWPLATYGVNYNYRNNGHIWPFDANNNNHELLNFEEPLVSFVPSIAASQLLEYKGNLFKRWKGDILVGTLVRHRLFRLRIKDNKMIVLDDSLILNKRMRDLIELEDGRLVVLTELIKKPYVISIDVLSINEKEQKGFPKKTWDDSQGYIPKHFKWYKDRIK